MDVNTFAFVSRVLVIIGWSVTFVVWLGYTAVAPWYKYSAGRYIWGLLFAILATLSTTMLRFIFPGLPYRMELILGTLALFDLAMILMGVGIYKAQILRYHKAKFVQQEREKHRQN